MNFFEWCLVALFGFFLLSNWLMDSSLIAGTQPVPAQLGNGFWVADANQVFHLAWYSAILISCAFFYFAMQGWKLKGGNHEGF